jgi:type I restriction enzyme M protein
MADQEQLDDFIEALEGLGGSAKNATLQESLGWSEENYEAVRAELVARRIVVRGRGRSNSVLMVGAEASVTATAASGAGRRTKASTYNGAGPIGFEAQLWKAADALRNNMDAAEYKHVVLGLLFLKYISDAFEAKYAEYSAEAIFWVPKEARWAHFKACAP